MELIIGMSGSRGRGQASLMLACLVLSAGCSTLSEESAGIPEIQGVWRSSEGGSLPMQASLTYEFQGEHFRIIGYPDIYARGKYNFEMSERGGYQVALAPEESQSFEPHTIQVQPTGGRILLIDRKIYRRILRH